MRVIVEGNIGAGKSTVMDALAKAFPSATVVPEPVEAWQEELELFYQDPAQWALPFSLRVLLAHHQNKFLQDDLSIIERCPLSNRHVFTQLLFNEKTMPQHHWDLYRAYYDVIGWEPGEHDLILYIDTPVDKCLERIQNRNRDGEPNIDIHYLRRIEFQYANCLKFCAASVVKVRGDQPPDLVAAEATQALDEAIQKPTQIPS